MIASRALAALSLLAALGTAACAVPPADGAATSSPLVDTEQELAEAERGRIDLQMLAHPAEGEAAGFRVAGVYSFEASGRYPVLDLVYVRTPDPEALGPVHVVSTGDAVYAGTEGAMGELPPQRADALRLEGAHGVADLGFSQWIVDPSQGDDRASGGRVTTGTVDVPALLSDLATLAAQIEGTDGLEELDEESASRLEQAATSSRMEVVTDPRTEQLRTLRVKVDFATRAGERLRAVLGPYAGVTLELLLRFEPLRGALKVGPPA